MAWDDEIEQLYNEADRIHGARACTEAHMRALDRARREQRRSVVLEGIGDGMTDGVTFTPGAAILACFKDELRKLLQVH